MARRVAGRTLASWGGSRARRSSMRFARALGPSMSAVMTGS